MSKAVSDWELGTHVYTQYSDVNNWRTPFSLAVSILVYVLRLCEP